MHSALGKWLKISLLNLMLVAFIGVILRYKIIFSLPFVNQKYLLHGHSHFAFAGWITQALMALLVAYLSERTGENYFKKYRWLLYANLITAYGMLFTFPLQGYAFLSILFSNLSIFVSYFFAFFYWRDLKKIGIDACSHHWFKASLFFSVLSSIGPFSLAYMMATKNMHQNWYLTSIYFFLHFQYNGWFFFACMGLLSFQLSKYGIPDSKLKQVYYLFAVACIPAFFLSILWLQIPLWLYLLIILAALLQIVGWTLLVRSIQQNLIRIDKHISVLAKRLFILCGAALTIKLLLQAASVIPSISKLAFGFRPIVIGYLHLVFLAITSLFIIAYIVGFKFIAVNKATRTGIIIFTFGIFLNELLLMIQGIADFSYYDVSFVNILLFYTAIILFVGILLFNYGQIIVKDDLSHKRSEYIE